MATEGAGVQSIQAAESADARTVFVYPQNAADAKDFAGEELDIRTILEKLGPIVSMRSQFDPSLRKFGFSVEYGFVKAAQLAVQLNGIALRGRALGIHSNVHRGPESDAANTFYASEEERREAERAALAASYRHPSLPHNHLVPEDLRMMPLLLPYVSQMAVPPPLPPAESEAADDAATAQEGSALPPQPMDAAPPLSAEDARQALLDAQREWVEATAALHAAQAELEKERRTVATRTIDLFALTLASGAPPQLHRTAFASRDVRLHRTVIVLDCPADTVAIVNAVEALAKHGPIRLYQISPPLRMMAAEGRLHVGVEFADDDAVPKVNAEPRLQVMKPPVDVNVVAATLVGLPGPLALAPMPTGMGWDHIIHAANAALRGAGSS